MYPRQKCLYTFSKDRTTFADLELISFYTSRLESFPDLHYLLFIYLTNIFYRQESVYKLSSNTDVM